MTRVTHMGRYNQLQAELSRVRADMDLHVGRLASGRRVTRYSDEPTTALRATALKSEDAELAAYESAADDARGWMSQQDSALQTASNLLSRAKELSVAGVNGALSPSARAAIADELDALRSSMIELANTAHQGRPLFGGFAASAVTDGAGGATFTGDDGAVQRRIGVDHVVQINLSGRDVFGFSAGDDVFAVLSDLADNGRAGDTAAIAADGTRLDTRAGDVRGALGNVGMVANQVDRAVSLLGARRDEITSARSVLVDTDLAESAMDMARSETAYQAAIAAVGRLQQLPSLASLLG